MMLTPPSAKIEEESRPLSREMQAVNLLGRTAEGLITERYL